MALSRRLVKAGTAFLASTALGACQRAVDTSLPARCQFEIRLFAPKVDRRSIERRKTVAPTWETTGDASCPVGFMLRTQARTVPERRRAFVRDR